MSYSNVNIGVVADWLVTYAGSESVIKQILNVFPESTLYAVVDFLNERDRAELFDRSAKTTFIQQLPFAKKLYQSYLPLMPYAIEQLNMKEHDIIISSSHAVSKGVLSGPDQLHISYVHSPMRYAWDLQHQYLKESGYDSGLRGVLIKWFLHKMRLWDCRTSNTVDHFIANSHFIARRIKKVYGRNADVIYPPVDISQFVFRESKDDYYMTASRLVPYKRIDLIVDAFSLMPTKKLVVIGDGPEIKKIKMKASSNVHILGYKDKSVLIDYMSHAKAFIFAAEEDFGIVPVEAQGCGTPVIAFGRGGALETVRPHGTGKATGLFFERQDVKSLIESVHRFEKIQDKILPSDCYNNALKFSSERFDKEFSEYVREKWLLFNENKTIFY
ncbi:glycosyltransferase family 4 protein [Serratia marcescens]|jgi:glycosyltransferase involved in cell wall biosynthesis|uniref:glycosyltransferase family 4 protein n=1 Tax=Serratia sp. BNK-4 TaxID=3376141 RepID=UPI0018D984D8|nr:glycosyltransferase family 4 protein [Serratia marcescens]MBH2969781.1 glycosyltransferase family 4 protein [Serratia marcescens]MBN6137694.1 glycosyltransferase family 4 protein [Serratia marcescens]